MPLIGTAGHVDHGKSTLIRRITGRDPDRWAEEKNRGLTIDLGFAWTTLSNGTEVSFVDVPGHERFLKNMLAGIEAIDLALFVVAADEGWMPQSEEHLAVLDLLEVSLGVVALTKADLVDEEMLGLVGDEVRTQLAGTTLGHARVIPVSSVNGTGIDDVMTEITKILTEVGDVLDGRPRLWVDRSFTATGAGTIVTGSLLDGRLATGDEVEVYPSGKKGRIRAIQSHETPTELATPGRRVALNLAGIDSSDIARGDMVGLRGHWEISNRLLVRLDLARYHEALSRRGAYQAHIGSLACDARITGLEGEHAVLTLSRAVPAATGDRFIMRDTGRRLVVAGGRVLDPDPGSARKAIQSARRIDPGGPVEDIAQALLEVRGMESIDRLAAHSRGGAPRDAHTIGETVVSRARVSALSDHAVRLVDAEHNLHPMRVGMPIATLAERLGTGRDVTGFVVSEDNRLEQVGPDVRRTGFEVVLDRQAEAAWQAARSILESGLDVPSVSEIGLDQELVHLKVRERSLIRVSSEFVFLPAQIDRIKEILGGLQPEFTVADFRDAAGLTRRYAVPILEWADREGLTVRRGDLRSLR